MTIIALILLLCLAALAGAQQRTSSTPLIDTLNLQAGKIRQARAARCLTPPRFRWHPGHLVPPHMRGFVIRQRRARLAANRALPRLCSPVDLGRHMAAARGWTGHQWAALYELWNRESGWNPCRHYPSTTNCGYTGSNACGIPQRVPCNGLIQQGARAQIRWGLGYIASRYGSPAGALAHSNTAGWY